MLSAERFLGIAGVDGNGQKEFAEIVAGIMKPTSGKLTFMGKDITGEKVKERFKDGISYISWTAMRMGLCWI